MDEAPGARQVVDPLAIGRRDDGQTPVARQLSGIATAGRDPPDLVASAAVRREVDRLAVVRECRPRVLALLRRQLAERTATGWHDEEIGVAVGPCVQHDLASIGRPPRRSSNRSAKARHRLRVLAVGVSYPDLARPAAIRRKGDPVAIWRVPRRRLPTATSAPGTGLIRFVRDQRARCRSRCLRAKWQPSSRPWRWPPDVAAPRPAIRCGAINPSTRARTTPPLLVAPPATISRSRPSAVHTGKRLSVAPDGTSVARRLAGHRRPPRPHRHRR